MSGKGFNNVASHLQGLLTLFYLPPSSPCVPAAMVKVAGAMGKSAEVMKTVNSLMKVADVQKAMQEMSKGAVEGQVDDEKCVHLGSRGEEGKGCAQSV